MSTGTRLAPTTSSTSTWKRAVVAVVVATVLSSVANLAIALVANAASADSSQYPGLAPAAYVFLTFFGVLVGALVWIAVRAKAANPALVMSRLVPAVVGVSLLADVAVGFGVGWTGAIALGLMHVAVAFIAVPVFHRALPLSR